ncbi:MAG: hypothetical protein J7M05_01775 [Anaerolineae bacterium]|nr:hypothetical protein [Anaerolineae bacterium]
MGALFLLLVGGVLGELNRGWRGAFVGSLSGAFLGAVLGGLVGTRLSPQKVHQRVSLYLDLERESGCYVPGEPIEGYLHFEMGIPLKIKGCKVYLLCQGRWTYDQDSSEDSQGPSFVQETAEYYLQEIELLPAGKFRRGAFSYPFSLSLPEDALPTHHGYACSLRWMLYATLALPKGDPLETHREVFVEALPPDLLPSPKGYRSTVSSELGQLTLFLPRVIVAEGETLEGQVSISPFANFAAEEMRVLLLRIENVPKGAGQTFYISRWDADTGSFHGERFPGGEGSTFVWLEDEEVLCEECRFAIAEPEYFSFQLRIPTQWRPTVATGEGRVVWKVAAVITRGGQSVLRAFHEVIVHTSTAEIAHILAPKSLHSPPQD